MVYASVNQCALDRIESELSNAPQFKFISHFLANVSSIEIVTNVEKSAFSLRILEFSQKRDDFNRRYIREEMRYVLESRCVRKFRPYSVQRTSIYTCKYCSRGSIARQNVVEGLITLENF